MAAIVAERLVPANATLSVVGDLRGLDVHALVDRDLAPVRSGKPAPPVRWGRVAGSVGSLGRPDIKSTIGVVGVIAPALTDTAHTYFSVFTLSAGGFLSRAWGPPVAPLKARFQFSLANDPEMARFYPSIPRGATMQQSFRTRFDEMTEAILDSSSVVEAERTLTWLAGGAMPPDLLKRSLADPSLIHTLATIHAALEAYGDEAFWSGYRARIGRAHRLDLAVVVGWYQDARRRIELVLHPE